MAYLFKRIAPWLLMFHVPRYHINGSKHSHSNSQTLTAFKLSPYFINMRHVWIIYLKVLLSKSCLIIY